MNNYELAELKWDTDYFGFPCAKLVITQMIDTAEQVIILRKIEQYQFITINNLSGNPGTSEFIGHIDGCFLVDVPVTLKNTIKEKTLAGSATLADGYHPCSKSIDDNLLKIARTSFKKARFYKDSHISENKAAGLYENWLRNSVSKEDDILLSDPSGRGFALISTTKDNIGLDIELIAIDSCYRGKGIGTAILRAVDAYAAENSYEYISVVTQADNVEALNFYIRDGFKFTSTSQIYHYWRL
jgi:dTDP-4-amino-4,6-dideoxy-D-galactose acyltransferase